MTHCQPEVRPVPFGFLWGYLCHANHLMHHCCTSCIFHPHVSQVCGDNLQCFGSSTSCKWWVQWTRNAGATRTKRHENNGLFRRQHDSILSAIKVWCFFADIFNWPPSVRRHWFCQDAKTCFWFWQRSLASSFPPQINDKLCFHCNQTDSAWQSTKLNQDSNLGKNLMHSWLFFFSFVGFDLLPSLHSKCTFFVTFSSTTEQSLHSKRTNPEGITCLTKIDVNTRGINSFFGNLLGIQKPINSCHALLPARMQSCSQIQFASGGAPRTCSQSSFWPGSTFPGRNAKAERVFALFRLGQNNVAQASPLSSTLPV